VPDGPDHAKWVSKADNGFFHSWAFTFRNHPDPIRIKPRNARYRPGQLRRAVTPDFVHEMLVATGATARSDASTATRMSAMQPGAERTGSAARPRASGASPAILVTALWWESLLAAILVSLAPGHHRRAARETRHPVPARGSVDEDTTDPCGLGVNWPSQWESYLRTTDWERTRYGGSDAIPISKIEESPWLRAMWSGYAFALDYRESRGHAFTLHDQDHTQRVIQRTQPGACLHCHAAVMPLYRYLGDGDEMDGLPCRRAR
jgi:hypothetical protein